MAQFDGIIKFETTPNNTDIYIDDKYLGKTPLEITDVSPGMHVYALGKSKELVGKLSAYSKKTTHIVVDIINNKHEEKYFDVKIEKEISQCKESNSENIKIEKNISNQLVELLKSQQEIINQLTNLNTNIIQLNNNSGSQEINYYDVSNTITYTTLTNPENSDSPYYDRERIKELLGRNSRKLTITNDGNGNIFVRISHDGVTFSEEMPIYESDVKIYYDIWEIRLRGDRAGCKYRITEYPLNNVTVNIQKSEKIIVLSTDKDTHFTGALNQNFMETELFTSELVSNKIRIVAINGQSMQPLKYRLIFWGSSATQNTTDLDSDTYLTDVVMDFSDTLSTFQIDTGAGLVNQYYLDVSALEGLYECFDGNYSMYVSLQNMSPVAKLAGAAGAVQFDIKYALRL